MAFQNDPRLDEAKLIPVEQVLDMLGVSGLNRSSHELIGPCPLCGGTDRFGVNRSTHKYLCRRCGIKGGDNVQLVRDLRGLDFKDALSFLAGDPVKGIDAEEIERRKAKARKASDDQGRRAEAERQKVIRLARDIWAEAQPAQGSPVHGYFEARGIAAARWPHLPPGLRFHPSLRYVVKEGRDWIEVHRGPAMLAAMVAPSGKLTAVHRTWIDLDQPKGKARIERNGVVLDAKKMLGSKKGAAIRLASSDRGPVMVMAEGIETTATALASGSYSGAAFWCAGDLGNISGIQRKVDGQRWSGLPDMGDERAFVPPPWVRELILIQDGDSHPASTRAKLLSGARRAMASVPGLRARIVHAGEGRDLNDIVMTEEGSDNA